jgi:putative membrane protein
MLDFLLPYFLWIKAFHIISVITWFAALFYLPRLFVYHAMTSDKVSIDRFKIMECKLYKGIMTPSMIIAVVLGGLLAISNWNGYSQFYWLHIKISLVVLLVIYHFYCGYFLQVFKNDLNKNSDKFYRYFNEFPVLILIAIVILVVVKPG